MIEDAIKETIVSYMRSQNRPYSVQNVFDNLRGEVPKAKALAALEAAVEEGILFAKSFGAQKFFCIKQESVSPEALVGATDELKSKLSVLREQIAAEKSAVDELTKDLRRFTVYKKNLSHRSELLEKIADIHRQINSIEASRAETADTKPSSKLSGDALEKQLEEVQLQLGRRKRISKRMIDEICEQSGISQSDLIGDLGLELCESRGC